MCVCVHVACYKYHDFAYVMQKNLWYIFFNINSAVAMGEDTGF